MVDLYLTKDGNGGFNISKSVLLIVAVLTVISIVATSGISYGALSERVDNVEDKFDCIETLDNRIRDIEITTAATNVRVQDTQKEISEIKQTLNKMNED